MTPPLSPARSFAKAFARLLVSHVMMKHRTQFTLNHTQHEKPDSKFQRGPDSGNGIMGNNNRNNHHDHPGDSVADIDRKPMNEAKQFSLQTGRII